MPQGVTAFPLVQLQRLLHGRGPPTERGCCSLQGNRSTAEQEVQLCPTSRKVERPMARLSEAPMRVKTASSTCRVADWAGTRQPTCRQGTSLKLEGRLEGEHAQTTEGAAPVGRSAASKWRQAWGAHKPGQQTAPAP